MHGGPGAPIGSDFRKLFLCSIYIALYPVLCGDTWRQGKVPRWLSRRLQNCFRNISAQCVVHTVLCEDTWIQLEASSTPGSDQESGNHHRSTSPSQFRWNLSLTRNSKCWKQAYPTHFPQFRECACVYFLRGIWTLKRIIYLEITASEMHVAQRIFQWL